MTKVSTRDRPTLLKIQGLVTFLKQIGRSLKPVCGTAREHRIWYFLGTFLVFSRHYWQVETLKFAIRVCQIISLPVWFEARYWSTYQNVQSSTGSTVIEV